MTTILMDYDGTLHDHDAVITRSIDGILGQPGTELYHTWRYRIHRDIIHTRHLNRHDDMLFHAQLLFQHLQKPYHHPTAQQLVQKFHEADQTAKTTPIYFTDAIPTLDTLKEAGITLCLSTGRNAEEKAETLARHTGTRHFTHIFSEPALGYLKTEPEYYTKALQQADADPRTTFSVGDTPLSDIRPANLTGITTIWLNRVNEPTPTAPDAKPHHTVTDLTQATEIILKHK
jgi:HAD superfamily hydrolase (TIGR01549 family)